MELLAGQMAAGADGSAAVLRERYKGYTDWAKGEGAVDPVPADA